MEAFFQIDIPVRDSEQAEVLIARISQIGAEGFEETAGCLHAFIPHSAFSQEKLQEVLGPSGLTYSIRNIEPTNWNEVWEKNFSPIRIDDFCSIRAQFHPPQTGARFEIVITPKMSFGTGHHATTRLMVRAMRGLEWPARRVLDFGTGTGILAVLAEKLGSDSVVAADHDPWSIQNAEENVAINGCHHIELIQTDNLEGLPVFDRILANINRSVLLANLGSLEQHLAPPGVLLLSGLLDQDLPLMEGALEIAGLSIYRIHSDEGWICLECQKFSSKKDFQLARES